MASHYLIFRDRFKNKTRFLFGGFLNLHVWLCADLSCNVLIECRLYCLISDIDEASFV